MSFCARRGLVYSSVQCALGFGTEGEASVGRQQAGRQARVLCAWDRTVRRHNKGGVQLKATLKDYLLQERWLFPPDLSSLLV